MSNVIYGLVACAIAAFCTGSGFVPIKRYPKNDCFFNQLILCIGSFFVAFIVNCIQGFPDVYPLVMIGGAIWVAGNAIGITIVNMVGLGVPVLLWNVAACVIGWSQTKFGWPNLPVQDIEGVWLNYIGLAILTSSSVFYVLVESESKSILTETHKEDFKRHGTVMPTDASLDYVFSFFIGALLASIVVFLVYSVIKKNRPVINNEVMLPSFVSGVSYGICQTFFIVANQEMSQSISYPLCTMLPGFVASLWSVLYFKEISGRRNFIILGFAYTLTLVGVVCVAVSKDNGF